MYISFYTFLRIVFSSINLLNSSSMNYHLRKGAIKAKIPYYTTIAAAKAAAEGIAYVKAHQDQNEEVNSLQGLHAQISDKF